MNEKGKPFISVVIPTYNRAGMLREAVESVLSQTYLNYELLVIDDGSTDDTLTVLEGYKPYVSVYSQPHLGVSSARNRGIELSRGEWLGFLDSDDLWLPEKLELQVDYIRNHPRCKIVHTNEIWLRNGVRLNQGKKHRKSGGWLFLRSTELCLISPSSVLVHRTIFQKLGAFDESLPACEDYDMWLRITPRYPVGFLKEALVIKRGGHPGQLSRSVWGLDRFRVMALEKALGDPKLADYERRKVLEVLEKKTRILVEGCRKRGKFEEADHYRKRLENLRSKL